MYFDNYRVKFIITIFYILTSLVLVKTAFAADFYEDCVLPDDYGLEENKENIILTPILNACHFVCKKECEAFSRSMYGNEAQLKSAKKSFDLSEELNEDVILDCLAQCQKGINKKTCSSSGQSTKDQSQCEINALKQALYTSNYYESVEVSDDQKGDLIIYDPSENKYFELLLRKATSTSTVCNFDDNADNVFETKFKTKANEKYSITLLGTGENKVFLCGKKSIKLIPTFKNMGGAKEPENDPWYTIPWKNKMSTRCLAALDDNTWKLIQTNKGAAAYWWGMVNDPQKAKLPCAWGARNYRETNTGIYIKDGDELSISWRGDFTHLPYYWEQGTVSGGRTGLIKCMFYDGAVSEALKGECRDNWFSDSNILSDNRKVTFKGEEFRIGGVDNIGIAATSPPTVDPKQQIDDYSLRHFVSDNPEGGGLQFEMSKDSYCHSCNENSEDSRCNSRKCRIIKNAGDGSYLAKGTLKNAFPNRTELSLIHFDVPTSSLAEKQDVYKDNQGGYQVDIMWGGCPKTNGENLQYALAKTKDAIDNWNDVHFNTTNNRQPTITIPSSQTEEKTLFLRIKPEAPSGNINDQAIKDLYSYYNRHGQYYLQITRESDGTIAKCDSTSGVIQNIIKLVRDTLVGTEDKNYENSVIKKIFNGFLSLQIRNIIKMLVIIYLCFFAISFMLGTIEANQQDFIKRLFKLAVVFMLMTDKAWSYFGGYFVPLFIDGSVELITFVASESYGNIIGLDKACIMKEPYVIFDVFDGPLKQLFSAAVWKKIWAVVLTGLLGFFGALMIIFGIGYYALTILKVAVMYTLSIVMVSLCICMAPVFLVLMLFDSQTTKQLFDGWMKNLISYALQPFFVFTSVIVFNMIIMMLILVTFNYTVCSVCLFEVDLSPFYKKCWLTGYHNVLGNHIPGNLPHFFMPLNVIIGGWAFYLGALAMEKFCGFIANLTSMIVTGSPIRHASIAEPAAQFETIATEQGKNALATTGGLLYASGGYMKAAGGYMQGKYQSFKQWRSGGGGQPGDEGLTTRPDISTKQDQATKSKADDQRAKAEQDDILESSIGLRDPDSQQAKDQLAKDEQDDILESTRGLRDFDGPDSDK